MAEVIPLPLLKGIRHFKGERLDDRGGGNVIKLLHPGEESARVHIQQAEELLRGVVQLRDGIVHAELDDAGIGLTTICPGLINTNIVSATGFHAPEGRDAKVPGRRAQLERMFDMRHYPPDKVAAAILSAVRTRKAIRPVTPEAYLLYGTSRLLPQVLRSTARGKVL